MITNDSNGTSGRVDVVGDYSLRLSDLRLFALCVNLCAPDGAAKMNEETVKAVPMEHARSCLADVIDSATELDITEAGLDALRVAGLPQ